MNENLKLYVDYNFWANQIILDFVNSQYTNLLDHDIKSSFSTIRKTFFHIWDAEYIWLERLNGRSFTTWPSKEFNLNTNPEKMLEISKAWKNFLENLNDSDFSMLCSYKNIDGKEFSQPASIIIMHCMNHSTFHRGQIISMLRILGVGDKIPSTDLITYSRM
jgi:uncharacterized damage-inducible protein DinB